MEAASPRARRSSARGGVRPSSETEPHPRGRLALERGEVVPRQPRVPREQRSSTRGWPGRLSSGPWVCFARAFRFVCVCFLRI
jgi:hypothetical protein